MGFFSDHRTHYTIGYLYGATLAVLSDEKAAKKIVALDIWAWNREWKQNLEGENPNDPMSSHQVEEAVAWGKGARKSRGINPPYPVPPYYHQP